MSGRASELDRLGALAVAMAGTAAGVECDWRRLKRRKSRAERKLRKVEGSGSLNRMLQRAQVGQCEKSA